MDANYKAGRQLNKFINRPQRRNIFNAPLTEIIHLLKQNPKVIDPEIHPIDADLFIPNIGEIDIVGVDANHLVMVSTFIDIREDHLRKAANINQWVFENLSVLKQTYATKGLSHNFTPRIILLCARVHPSANPLLPFISDLPLEVFRYQYFKNETNRYLELTKVEPNQNRIKTASSPLFTKLPTRKDVELTAEELGAFYEAAAELEGEAEAAPALDFDGPYFN
ncbi:MAG: hypothetical protein ABH859_02395 [Pseudomonadota bacterium]